MMTRDTQLDIYRALIMIYILCVVHIVYFLPIGNLYLRSIILIEMPLIFFISGVAVNVSGSNKSFGKTVKGRFKRILVPYYIYIAVSLLIAVIAAYFSLFDFRLPEIKYTYALHALIGNADSLIGNGGHIWFITPYLMVVCSYPLQRLIMKHLNNWVYMALIIVLFIISLPAPIGRIKLALMYNVYFMAGVLFYKRLEWKTIYILTLGIIITFALYLWVSGEPEPFMSMNRHKFAPDVVFLLFGACSLMIVCILFGHVHLKGNSITKIWNSQSYSIYLYQNFFFVIIDYILLKTGLYEKNTTILVLASTIMLFIMATSFGLLYGHIEQKVSALLNRKRTVKREQANQKEQLIRCRK